MNMLKLIITLLLVVLALALAYGFYRTWKTGTQPEYAEFLKGTIPAQMPEGLWNGSAPELGEISWKGKKFSTGTGINVFEKNGVKSEAYTFKFFETTSIKESGMKVIRLDYGQKENPLWLRFIVDEMVSTGENKFLGVVYINAVPGLPFRMGYFRLQK